MKAIRKFEDVKSRSVKIDLPDDFHAKRVEIIILPVENSESGQPSLTDLLLKAPTLTDNELQEYGRVRDVMSKWNIKKF